MFDGEINWGVSAEEKARKLEKRMEKLETALEILAGYHNKLNELTRAGFKAVDENFVKKHEADN